MMEEPGYLVIYEDDDTGEEREKVVFSVDAPRPPDSVVADFGAQVTNRAHPLAAWGLGVTLTGTLMMLVTTVLFLLNYPEAWFIAAPDAVMARTVVGLGLGGVLLLLLGNLFVGFGRQLYANGTLHSLRFVRPDE